MQLVTLSFDLDIEVHNTSTVLYELYTEQQIYKAYHSVGRIAIHNLLAKDYLEIYKQGYLKSLSETDKSVLYIANKLDASVLSSDKALRNCAKNKGIEYHGMIWIFDRLVETSSNDKKRSNKKLKQLIITNFVFQNNQQN